MAQGTGRAGIGSQQVAILLCVLVLALSLVAAVFVLASKFRPEPQVLDTSAVPEEFRDRLLDAATRCPTAISAPLLAAQIDVESGWHPDLITARGYGLAQLPQAVYDAYGIDGDGNGYIEQLNPSDAIPTQANYLCDLAQRVEAPSAQSDVPIVNLTLAAFHVGPEVVTETGGVLTAEAEDYVQRVLSLLPKYSALAKNEEPAQTGGWVDPLAQPFQRGTQFWVPGKLWRWKGHHTGVDFTAATGTQVYAAGPGVISDVRPNGGAYGNYIVIQHGTVDGSKIETLYAHMSGFADVEVGDEVEPGDVIGYVGVTGNTTGPHLHFEVHRNWTGGGTDDQFLDGFQWLDDHRNPAAPRWGPAGGGDSQPMDGDDGPPR